MSALPLLGAALTLRSVEQHRDWLFEQNRDLELQEFHQACVLDGDWRSVVDACKRALDGFHGRLSIHGPFWGFSMDSRDPLVSPVFGDYEGLLIRSATKVTADLLAKATRLRVVGRAGVGRRRPAQVG